MENPAIYGDTFEMLSFKGALECHPPILSDYQIVTVAVTQSEVAELIAENMFVRPDRGHWSDDVEAEMLAAAIALRKAIQRRPIKEAVSFHSSIARAKAFKAIQDGFGGFSHLQDVGYVSRFGEDTNGSTRSNNGGIRERRAGTNHKCPVPHRRRRCTKH